MWPELSVIIPHHGDLSALHICLLALERCDDRDRAEIVVVINAQAPAARDFQYAHPNIRFLHEPQAGAAHARNTGANAALSALFLFIDSDCTAAPDALSRALSIAPTGDVFGGNVVATTPKGQTLSAAQAFETVFAFDQETYVTKKGFSVTACLLTHRHVFDAVGGFAPGLSEDMDWCHRATAMGFRLCYAPDLKVTHPCRPTWGALRRKWQRLTAQTFALPSHNRVLWTLKACAMPLSIMAHIPRILAAPRLPHPRDKLAAIAMLTRLRLWRMGEMLRLGRLPRL